MIDVRIDKPSFIIAQTDLFGWVEYCQFLRKRICAPATQFEDDFCLDHNGMSDYRKFIFLSILWISDL